MPKKNSVPAKLAKSEIGKLPSQATWHELKDLSEYSSESHCIISGDSHRALSRMPDESCNTCLTSPPYWGVRDYEHRGQIGLEESVEDYVESIINVFREVKRVLTPDGTAWLNLGDSYLNSMPVDHGGWKKNKQLGLIPIRVAIALQETGWLVRNSMVWSKPNAMPSSVRDRLTNTWEPVFLLSKREQYYFNLDPIRVPHKTDDLIERLRAESTRVNGKASGQKELRKWLNSPRHRATIDGKKSIKKRPNAPDPTILAQYLRDAAEEKGFTIKWIASRLNQPFERVRHYFRTDAIGSRLPPEETWEELKQLLDLGTHYDDMMEFEMTYNVFRNHPNGRNPGDVQQFSLIGSNVGHFATMPKSLAHWALSATLPINGVCLDPFMGSGTTGIVSLQHGSRFVGIELREDYCESAHYALNNLGSQLTLRSLAA